MKKMIFVFVLILLLLCGCASVQTPEETVSSESVIEEETSSETEETPEDVPIVNGWTADFKPSDFETYEEYEKAFLDEYSERYHLNFSLLATPAEGLSGRFVRMDKKRFGEIKGVTDKEYYTNSFHVPVAYDISAYDKINLEAPYHALTNAGHITYVELDGDVSQNLEAFEAVVRCMKEAGIGYGAINHPVDRDPVCGYNGIIGDVCPRCGRRDGEGVPLEKLQKLGLYKHLNAATLGQCGNQLEEADRIPNRI